MQAAAVTQEDRDAAARFYLEDEDAESSTYDETEYGGGNYTHRILTDEEADEAAFAYIRESVWAFNASFLVDYLPNGVSEEVIEALLPQCEGANEALLSMIGDRFEEFASDAIATDGRGHFLNSYDGNEDEFEFAGRTWYAVRT